jgi:hypothetical protein
MPQLQACSDRQRFFGHRDRKYFELIQRKHGHYKINDKFEFLVSFFYNLNNKTNKS